MNFRIFIGEAQTAIDEKGRTAFPRDFRRQLSDGERENLVVTKGPEGSLRLFVFSEFEKFMAELDSMRDRRLAELVRGNLSMQLVNLDGQSRILLPKKLLQIAGLENEILWIPARGKTLALWKPETFNAKIRQNTIDADAMFDSVFYGSGLTEGSNGNT